MELHGNHDSLSSKEIRCSDCGHVYLIAQGQRSSRCEKCGNIEFLSKSAEPLRDIPRQPMQLLQDKVFARVQSEIARIPQTEPLPDPLREFASAPDGHAVDQLLMRYQVEWQLWSELVKHFANPAYHAAYLALVLGQRDFSTASARYRDHRAAMLLLREDRWQAEVADLMLTRLDNLASVCFQQEERGRRLILPAWLLLLPWDSRVMRIGWITAGMLVVMRLFHFI